MMLYQDLVEKLLAIQDAMELADYMQLCMDNSPACIKHLAEKYLAPQEAVHA